MVSPYVIVWVYDILMSDSDDSEVGLIVDRTCLSDQQTMPNENCMDERGSIHRSLMITLR